MHITDTCHFFQAMQWLQSTFFWTRLLKSPGSYGLRAHDNELALASHVKAMFIDSSLTQLQQHGLIEWNLRSDSILSQEPGM